MPKKKGMFTPTLQCSKYRIVVDVFIIFIVNYIENCLLVTVLLTEC